jgi:glutathione S-transferase
LLPLLFDPVLVAEFDRKGRAALDMLDPHLLSHRFLVGDRATIADICCYAEVAFARLSNKDLAAWPSVVAWAGRIEALPGFAEPFDLLAMRDAEVAPYGSLPSDFAHRDLET